MGHIPTLDTRTLTDCSFEAELACANRPSAEYDVNRWLFVPNHYTEFRYILGTRGRRPLICNGVNPSTAPPDALDNTLKSVERIAHGNGFDSFLMFNVYAQRATNPNDMDRELDERLHRENMNAFAYILALSDAPTVWAAWGAVICKRPYLKRCVEDMIRIGTSRNAQWVRCGACSKAGHPHHPLYLRADAPLEPFDVAEYVRGAL